MTKNPQGNQLVALGIFKVVVSNAEPTCVSSRSHRVAKRIFKCVYRKGIVLLPVFIYTMYARPEMVTFFFLKYKTNKVKKRNHYFAKKCSTFFTWDISTFHRVAWMLLRSGSGSQLGA